MAAAKPKTDTTEVAFEEHDDQLLALALGAENIDDLQALLEGAGFVQGHADEGEQLVFVFGTEVDAEAAETAPQQKKTWRSIMERAGGDMAEARRLANWLLHKRQVLQAEIAEKQDFVEKRISDLNGWLLKEQAKRENTINWFDDLLLRWHRDTGNKQEALPRGNVQWDKARVKTEWDELGGLKVAIAKAIAEAEDIVADATNDEDERGVMLWAVFAEKLAELVDIRKTPIKELLTKRDDGSFVSVNEDGEASVVISVAETGEVPTKPLPADAAEDAKREPLDWCKPGETYKQVIKDK